jgi:hypothetical protein
MERFGVDAGVSLIASRGGDRGAAAGAGGSGRTAGRERPGLRAPVVLRRALPAPSSTSRTTSRTSRVWPRRGRTTGRVDRDGVHAAAMSSISGSRRPSRSRSDWTGATTWRGWAGPALGWLGWTAACRRRAFETRIRFPDFDDTRIGSRIGEVRRHRLRSRWARWRPPGWGRGRPYRIRQPVRERRDGVQAAADAGWLGASYGQVAWRLSEWLLEAGAAWTCGIRRRRPHRWSRRPGSRSSDSSGRMPR